MNLQLRATNTDLFEETRSFGRFASVGRDLECTRLSFDIDPNVPKITILDWRKTKQVLNSLVSNAVKAENGRGVVISISSIDSGFGGQALRFEVRDHGAGIPESAAAVLFQPFQKAVARDTGAGGSGLGLAISHYLVDAMGGRIGYENQPHGTSVWFDVPMEPVAAEARTAALNANSPKPRERTARLCLLVDDDPVGSVVTTRQLEHLGLVVTRTASVKEAMAFAASAKFDVFVVDYLLPDGDGPGLAKALKPDQSASAKFFALTANVEALADREKDFDQVLAKPADQVGLASAIFGSAHPHQPKTDKTRGPFDGLQGLTPQTVSAMIATIACAWAAFRTEFRDLRAAPKEAELAITTHRLAGICAVLGLFELETPLRQLETACLDQNRDVDLASFAPALDRDLTDLLSWQHLNALWAAE